MLRELFSAGQNGDYNAGVIIGMLLGTLYFMAFIYLIYKRYLSIIFEDLICILDGKDNEEAFRPVLYGFLNSLLYLIFCFFSTFSSQSDLAISVIIGSDAFNIFLILALIFWKYKDQRHGDLNEGITLRDVCVYIVGLISYMLFLIFDWVNLWSALILCAFYIGNFFVIYAYQEIKETIMEWLGLNNEDNEFNSDEHFQFRKRRESSSNLKDLNCFDSKDINLQKKLNRMEALLVLKYKTPDHPQKIIYARFQKAVYQVIFALKNQIRLEREKRTEAYLALYKPKGKKKSVVKNDLESIQNDDNKKEKEQSSSQQDNQVEDADPLIFKVAKEQEQDKADSADLKDQNQGQDNNQDNYQEGGVSLKMPKTLAERIFFILFYPLNLILYLLPNYLENPIPKKLVLCIFLNIVLLSFSVFLIDWWLVQISLATRIPVQIIGLIIGGILLSWHFLEYNLQVANQEKQLEFFQSFIQIAICKISICPSIPWLVYVITQLDINIQITTSFGFALSIAILAVAMLVLFIVIALSHFKLGQSDSLKMGVIYFIFMLIAIVLIAIYP